MTMQQLLRAARRSESPVSYRVWFSVPELDTVLL